MPLDLKNLFKKDSVTTPTQNDMPQVQNPNNKQEGETYHHWGLRVCAIADGSCFTLVPYLQNVYNYIYREQVNNQALQDSQKKEIECKIEQKQRETEGLEKKLANNQQQQNEAKDKISDLNKEKTEIKNKAYEVNKEAKLKLIIGLIILVPLTLYLFLFYSSTFYSAFFKDFSTTTNVLNSMFDAEALSKALEASFTELCFVLCAPIIFMGLGFALHFFTIQKSFTKYFKMAAILCITFIFDAILAYMIGKHLHEMEVIIGTAPLNSTYGFNDAVSDINTWAVIFCGFIVYIIWGIVFDMSMSAYNQLDLNKINIKAIDQKILLFKNEITELKQKEQDLNNNIISVRNAISTLTAQISKSIIIDKAAIKTEMTNFFSGWVAQMSVLGMTNAQKQEATNTFNNTLKTLLTD